MTTPNIEDVPHEKVLARVAAAKSRFATSVRPLFRPGKPSHPVLVGCGVLVAIGESRFVFTAAHVIDEFQTADLLIAGLKELIGAEGIAHRNDPAPGLIRDADKTDAAVFEIKAGSLPELEGHYLETSDLSPDAHPIEGRMYLILGYPSSRAKVKVPERTIRPELFPFITGEAPIEAYQELGIERFSHIALNFDQKSVTDGKKQLTAPKPNGLSGCGVWRFDSVWRDDWQDRDKLIAILTERHTRDARALVATRVAIHLAIVSHSYPALRPLLPRSGTTTVRVHDKGAPI